MYALFNSVRRREIFMNMTSESVNREFKVWMTMTVGLLKDGKMGATRERAERIKTAMAYARKRS